MTIEQGSERSKDILAVNGVDVTFGGVHALDSASFSVDEGQFCGLIGPNGAGKTTLFNCISGFVRPNKGSIKFIGRDLMQSRRHQIVKAGVARTFQNVGLISDLTVLQNVMVGAYARTKGGYLSSPFIFPTFSRTERGTRIEAEEVLSDLGLASVASRSADGLPFGTLKRIELARALLSHPRLLLLDEPANGLTHGEVAELATVLSELREKYSLTVVLVEHHMGLVMGLCDKIVVLESGRIIADGAPAAIQQDPAVIAAYLGAAQ